jgi:hypothetical protein
MGDLFEADVNYLAVILGALAVQVLGFLWYSKLFYKPWVDARAIDPSEGEGDAGAAMYLVPLVCALIVAYTFARLADMVGAGDVGECIALAAFVWVGFAGTVQLTQINFSDAKVKRMPTFLIEGGYQLASFVIIGAVIGAFQ